MRYAGSSRRGGITIYSKFIKLDPTKKERILNAAMKEFAQKGYKNASTDSIVKDAGISKGALFHYFSNKKGLFLYLYEYALDIMKNEILMKLDTGEKDVFKRRRQAILQKLEVFKIHPPIYEFLTVTYLDDESDIKTELDKINSKLMIYGKSKLYDGIDTSLFKDSIDISKALEIITWTDEGFIKKVTSTIKTKPFEQIDYNQILSDLDSYMDILKSNFYKE